MVAFFQPGEGPSRGLLRDYEPSDGPSFQVLVRRVREAPGMSDQGGIMRSE